MKVDFPVIFRCDNGGSKRRVFIRWTEWNKLEDVSKFPELRSASLDPDRQTPIGFAAFFERGNHDQCCQLHDEMTAFTWDYNVQKEIELSDLKSQSLDYKYDDGGRSDAGYKGHTGDCVTRAIAIATGQDYETVRSDLMDTTEKIRAKSKARHIKRLKSNSVRDGVHKEIYVDYLKSLGWTRTACIKVGSKDRKKLTTNNLPKGNVIVEVQKHLMASIDHVVHDAFDSRETNIWENNRPTSRKQPRTIVAYWTK